MAETNNTSENWELSYTEVSPTAIDKSDAIVNLVRNLLFDLGITPFDFEAFLSKFLSEQGISENELQGIAFDGIHFELRTSDHGTVLFSLWDIGWETANAILWERTQEELEASVNNIFAAIEWIYSENDGIFAGDINDEDIVDTDIFGENLKGKTLWELRDLFEIEKNTLFQVYSVIGESQKKREILRREIELFGGIGDKYEWGARYFSLSSEEIQERLLLLIDDMNYEEIFDYIIHINTRVSDNWKRSDMVNQINGKVINTLYSITFEKLKQEGAENKYFIDFVKIITGRDVVRDGREIDVETNDNFTALDTACKALIHVMYQPGWVLSQIQEEIVVEDEEVSNQAPSSVIAGVISELWRLQPENPGYASQLLEDAGFWSLIGTTKTYNDLSFEEKTSLGALYRIGEVLKEASPEDLLNPDFVSKSFSDAMMASYEMLNDSFSDNFDGWNGFFGGYSSDDLGLSGDLAEIFDLYQDINGNAGFLDWSDANQARFGNISTLTVLGIGLIAWVVIFAPLLWAAAWTVGIWSMLWAWAQVGFITSVASQALSEHGYDTYSEARWDIWTQLLTDTASSALFTLWGLSAIRYLKSSIPWAILDVPLLFSREAWKLPWLIDKWFIAGEVGISGMIVSPFVAEQVRSFFQDNRFDSDTHRYVDGEIVERE